MQRCLSVAVALTLVAASAALTFKAPEGGQNWALLMAGSNTWGNYRHQADIYHAYQIVKKGGIPEENIVVMHYDDIANAEQNPKKGTVINSPDGPDVYAGVPKDYTGSEVNAANFLAALAGNASAVQRAVPDASTTCDKRGKFVCPASTSCCCDKHGLFECHDYICCNSSTVCGGRNGCVAPPPPKKVIASGPNDHVFVYFADHGGPGILGVPNDAGDYIHAKDVVDTLKAKAAAGGFKQLTFYIEACESGSIFDGLLPDNINVYATTAANPSESSWGTYCPGMTPAPPSGYDTCLGDLYSIAWLENADTADLKTESLEQQYELVKQRTSNNGTYSQGSHVMQYGQLDFDSEAAGEFEAPASNSSVNGLFFEHEPLEVVPQRDGLLVYLHNAYLAAKGKIKEEALKAYHAELMFREKIDGTFKSLVTDLVGHGAAHDIMTEVHTPVVQDWDCFKAAIKVFQSQCMPMKEYGMRHTRALANLCDAGITPEKMSKAAEKVCF